MRELALTGELIDADRALAIGLINVVADDVVPAALALAASVAEAPGPRSNASRRGSSPRSSPRRGAMTPQRGGGEATRRPPAIASANAEVPEQFRRE